METQRETCEDEINLLDYVRIIVRHKWLVFWIVGVVVAATAAASLVMTSIYEAKTVIAPVGKGTELSGAGAIAAQFGIASPSSSTMSEIVNLLKSNVLREEIIRKHNLLPILLKEKNLAGKSDSERLWTGIRFLEETLRVTPNQKDNAIQLTMAFKDPNVAAEILGYTLAELTEHMSGEARRVAETNKKYLESQVDKTADPYIKAKIYGLIAQQIETSMMAEVKENFAFKVLDPPKAPDKRIKPKRTQMVVIAFVVALFMGIFAAFGREYLRSHKEELKGVVNS